MKTPEVPVSDKPKRNPETAHRSVADEGGLVVVPGASEVKVLNPVASKIFSMLDGQHSRDEIVAAVMQEFDVEEQRARQDPEDFLAELRKHDLLADSAKPQGEPA